MFCFLFIFDCSLKLLGDFVFFFPFLFALKAFYNVVLAGIRAVTEV